MPISRESIWSAGSGTLPSDAPVGPVEADVAVIGGGIVGVTAAFLLRQRGLDVVLIEARQVGEQATGGSSAKVTSQHSLIYGHLASTFGDELARGYGEANQWAIGSIEAQAHALGIDCSFEHRSAYTYTTNTDRLADVQQEASTAARLGLPARFTTDVPLPFETAGALVFDGQAQFDPLAYTLGVAAALRREGGRVLQGVRVTGLEDREWKVRLETTAGDVIARDVIIATNLPFVDDGLYFARAAPRAHAVLAARVPEKPVDGMFISIDDPTRSLRSVHRDGTHWVLLVGPSFTPGDSDTEGELAALEAFARQHFPVQAIDHGWWNEDYYSADRLPYVGRLEGNREHVYLATGFSGWGITNGHVAAHILADAVTRVANPWAAIFDSTRRSAETSTSPLAEIARVFLGNLDTARNLVARLLPVSDGDPHALVPGEGRVMTVDGDKVAVARDASGTLHAVSAMCTHLGCELAWNSAMQTWDCGCHGSCFEIGGGVLRGPAMKPLEPKPEVIVKAPPTR